MKRSLFKKIAIGIVILHSLNSFSQSCNASFTYTVGSSGQVSFTNTSTGLGTNPNYSWTFGDNASSALASPNHTYPYNGGYWVTLLIDSANGGSSCTFTDSITISNALTCNLTAAFTYTLVGGGSANFTDVSTGVDPGMIYNWQWNSANGNIGSGYSAQQSPSFNFTYNGTYNVTMQLGDPTQTCQQTVTQLVTVTNGLPCQVSFTYAQGGSGLVNFTNTSQGNNGYYWNFGDGSSSTQQSPVHTYAYNGLYYIYLNADTSVGGCGGSAWDSVIITNTQNTPTCTAAFTYTLGSSGQVSFSNTSTGTVVNPVYNWNFGNGNTSAVISPSYTYLYNGTYNVYLYEYDSTGINLTCYASQQVTISNALNCGDSAYFTLFPDTSQVSTWYVNFYTNTGNSPLNAVWSWGDSTTSTGLSPSHVYANAGWYNICVTAYFACGDSSVFCLADSIYKTSGMISVYVINNTTGITTNTNNMTSLKAYPNPFSDDLTVNFTSYESKTITYAMFDMLGNQVAKERVSVHKGDNEFKINTGVISKGVYFINLSGNDGKKTSAIKVVK